MKGFTINTDKSLLDFDTIYGFISDSYWAKGIPTEVMQKAIDNSMCFGVYEGNKQVGFARIISDYATFAYLADVFIIESHQGLGLSKWLVEAIVNHSELQGLRRMMLATKDAHGLYQQKGFEPVSFPENLMQIWQPDVYQHQDS